tara:strand:- start:367 stop:567 length:201 start_codon:yes stop_codon:yes gene_type:complete
LAGDKRVIIINQDIFTRQVIKQTKLSSLDCFYQSGMHWMSANESVFPFIYQVKVARILAPGFILGN